MRQRLDRRRPTCPHAGDQHGGLPVEQLQQFALEIGVAEGHARELRAIDRRRMGVYGCRLALTDCGLRHVLLPIRPFVIVGAECDLDGTKSG